MSCITNFDDIFSRAPCLIISEAFKHCLQSGLVEINQHGHIVDLPLDKIAAVEASSVSESELQLLWNLLRDMSLDVRDDRFIVAPSG